MTPMIDYSLLLAAALAMLFFMWRTNSLRTSVSTVVFIANVAVTNLLQLFELHLVAFYLTVVVMGALVWRQIPNRRKDYWVKA